MNTNVGETGVSKVKPKLTRGEKWEVAKKALRGIGTGVTVGGVLAGIGVGISGLVNNANAKK